MTELYDDERYVDCTKSPVGQFISKLFKLLPMYLLYVDNSGTFWYVSINNARHFRVT